MPPVSRWVAASSVADQLRADRAPVATNDARTPVDTVPVPTPGSAAAEPTINTPARRRGTLVRLLLGSGNGASP